MYSKDACIGKMCVIIVVCDMLFSVHMLHTLLRA